ncbi:hypothetical protein [Shewanella mangrovisoli]|uniref:hypothetical protein n=1 Tax=Shewanella mangrovisoli TaxID=2864211 RepID=UPI001C65F6A7|nr:hypothetical protein [Shewanella mangrovisoli]QYK10379.1 hypothetical protein K0H60_06775 [Shewanella mangrovisoli]
MTETSSQEKFTKTLEGIIEQNAIPEKPDFLKVLYSLPDSPEKDQMFEDMEMMFSAMTKPSSVSDKIPRGTSEDTAAKELAKCPDSQNILAEEQQTIVQLFSEMLSLPPSDEPLPEMDTVRKFANADFPIQADASDEDEAALLTLINSQPEAIAEFLQAMMACHMAGLNKAANLLNRLFAKQVLIIENESYQSLQEEVTKHRGVIETSGSHSSKGQDKRHSKNRLRKDFALKLYSEKPSKNPKQASQRFFKDINQYANSIGHPFTSEYQGIETVYRWFLKAKNNQTSSDT